MPQAIAFEGLNLIRQGDFLEVAIYAKAVLDRGEQAPVLVFDDETGRPLEVDFRGTIEEVYARLHLQQQQEAEVPARGPGRPKLGVTAREVTLLPRHWDWLATQPGGTSVALRRLVDEARRASAGLDRVRQAQESAYRFLSAMAGNLPGFEEALRALFAGDAQQFARQTEAWPPGLRDHARKLAARAGA